MEIAINEIGAVAVVRFEGNLDTNTSLAAQETLDELIDQDKDKVLINLKKVDFVSSAGLRVLLATAKRLTGTGGGLRITDLNESVSEVFDISGFSTILDVFSTEEVALEDF